MEKPTKSDCVGCHDNFYNGNNVYGITTCWSLESAEFQEALDIPVDLSPPYLDIKPTKRPSCYKAHRMLRVKLESLDEKGYWRI